MKTMDCSTLEKLIENREELDVIDIRPKQQYSAMHIPRSRSVPFSQLARSEVFRQWHPRIQSVYVISDDRAQASLATGILRASGYVNSMVVEGGIKEWVAMGFPVRRAERHQRVSSWLKIAAGVLTIISAIAIAAAKGLIGAMLLAVAIAVFAEALLVERTPAPFGRLAPGC